VQDADIKPSLAASESPALVIGLPHRDLSETAHIGTLTATLPTGPAPYEPRFWAVSFRVHHKFRFHDSSMDWIAGPAGLPAINLDYFHSRLDIADVHQADPPGKDLQGLNLHADRGNR